MTSTSPDEIRAEIEATREHLGHDLEELSERISPRRVASRTAENMRHRMSDAGSKITAVTGTVADRAKTGAEQATTVALRQLDAHPQVASTVQKAQANARTMIESGRSMAAENPQAAKAVAGGLAVLALLLTLIRRRRHHDVAVVELGRPDDPLVDPA